MQVTDELIRSVVQEVLSHLRNGMVKLIRCGDGSMHHVS